MDLETQLREKIRAIYEEAQRQAKPLVDKLSELESLKPPRMFVIPADLARTLGNRRTMQDSLVWDEILARHALNLPPETPPPPPLSPQPGTSATDTAG